VNKVPANKVSYHYSFRVEKEHLDALEHVNNIVYLSWVQQAAENHWNRLASAQIKSNYIWMALRHEIDYLGQAFLNDELSIYTWIDRSSGAKSIRIVKIYKGDQLLTQCKTTWVMLAAKSLKPKRIGGEILALFTKEQGAN